MFAFKTLILSLAATAQAEQVATCVGDCNPDDTTMLLQNKVDVHSSSEKAQPTELESEEDAFWREFNSASTKRAANAEYIAMILFVFIGCGSAAALAYPNGSKRRENLLLQEYNYRKTQYNDKYDGEKGKKWEADKKVAEEKASNPNATDEDKKELAALIQDKLALERKMQQAFDAAHAGEGAWKLHVSLAFGLAITVLVYAIGHISGGHINFAVTYGLYHAGQISWAKAMAYLHAQLQGAVVGAALVWVVFGRGNDRTDSLGCNAVAPGYSLIASFVGELLGTFLLVFVVLETAVDSATKADRMMAAFAIGLAVFLAHTFLIPVDGCSINPTRSSGPPLLAIFQPLLDWTFEFLNLATGILRAIPQLASPDDDFAKNTGLSEEDKKEEFGELFKKFSKKTAKDMGKHFWAIKDLYTKEKLLSFLNIFTGLVFFWVAPCLGAKLAAHTWKSLRA